jgi:S-adenosylmethionine uptake transporter
MQSHLRGALLSLAAFGLYASHDVVVKFLGGTYSTFQTMFFAGLMGFPLITLMLLSDRRDGTLIPRHPWWTITRTVSSVVTGVMGFFAFSQLPMAQCYAIFFAMPLLITLMAIPMLGEKVGLRRGLAVIVGLLGVMIVLRPGGEVPLGVGHLAALGAATTGAFSSVIVRKIGRAERSVVLMIYPMVLTFLPWAGDALRLQADAGRASGADRGHGGAGACRRLGQHRLISRGPGDHTPPSGRA